MTDMHDEEAAAAPDARKLLLQARALIKAQRAGGPRDHEDGVAALKRGDNVVAEAAFRRAIAANPEVPWSHHGLAETLSFLSRWDEAEVAFQRASALAPTFPHAYHGRGECLRRLGRHDEAAIAFRRALALDRSLGHAAKGLARALVAQANTLLAEARRAYTHAAEVAGEDESIVDEALALRPVDAAVCAALADALARRGATARAIGAYRLSLDARPDDAGTLLGLARALRDEGDLARALLACERALERAPGIAAAHALCADLLDSAGRTNEAISACERALAIATEPRWQHHLGDLLARAGRIDEAAAALARAVELGWRAF